MSLHSVLSSLGSVGFGTIKSGRRVLNRKKLRREPPEKKKRGDTNFELNYNSIALSWGF